MPTVIEGKGRDNSEGYGLLVLTQRVGSMGQHIQLLLMALKPKVLNWIVKSWPIWLFMIHSLLPS